MLRSPVVQQNVSTSGGRRISVEQERTDALNSGAPSPCPSSHKLGARHVPLQNLVTQAREESLWPVRSPRATEVYSAAKADLASASSHDSPVKLKLQQFSNSSSRGSSPARWKAGAGALSPIPILQGSNSAAASPTLPPRMLGGRDSNSNGSSRFMDEEGLQSSLLVQQAQQHQHLTSHQQAGGPAAVSVAVTAQQHLAAHRSSSAGISSIVHQPLCVRDAAAVESPGRPRRTISAPGSQLHTYALQQATMQQQQQQQAITTAAGENSPRPHHYSSLQQRLHTYANLPLTVPEATDGHVQLCDTPDSNCSGHSMSSAMLESPHQPAATRFKPRPPCSSSGGGSGSASSTPHSLSTAGSVASVGSGASSGGGSTAGLQPHPPHPTSGRKASKPSPGLGVMNPLPECGSPQVYPPCSFSGLAAAERMTDSPVPGGVEGSSTSFRRRNYSVATNELNSSRPGPLGRATSLIALGNDGSNPSSPSAAVRTPSSGGGMGFLTRQGSGNMGELPEGGSGGASPFGSAAIMGGAFSGSASGASNSTLSQVGFAVMGQPRSAASPLSSGSSSMGLPQPAVGHAGVAATLLQPLSMSASQAGSGPAVGGSVNGYSRPSSGGKICKTVCLLVDAVRSRDDSQLQEYLAYCAGGSHGLNDLHPIYDRTPLHEAVCLGLVTMVRMLLAAGANPNRGHPKEGGPLLQAAAVGATDIVELLLDAGANTEGTDAHRRTALHHACRGGHVEAARLLVSRGAALTARTVDGETPLDLARRDVQRALCCGTDERSPTGAQAEAPQHQLTCATASSSAMQHQHVANISLPSTPGNSRDPRHSDAFSSGSSSGTANETATARQTQQQASGAGAHSLSSSVVVTPDSSAPTPAAPSSTGISPGFSRASSGSGALTTPAVTPASGAHILGGMFGGPSFGARRISSGGGGHGTSGAASSSSGGLLSHFSGAATSSTGQNTAVNSPSGNSGLLPGPPFSTSSTPGVPLSSGLPSSTAGGQGTPPISPSSLADAVVGPSGMRRPSPPVSLGSAPSSSSVGGGGGSGSNSRWGSRSQLTVNTGDGGESITPVDQMPEERAPTPPVLNLPIQRFKSSGNPMPTPNRKNRVVRSAPSTGVQPSSTRSTGGTEDTQRGLAEDDQAVVPAGSHMATVDDAAKLAAARRLEGLTIRDFGSPRQMLPSGLASPRQLVLPRSAAAAEAATPPQPVRLAVADAAGTCSSTGTPRSTAAHASSVFFSFIGNSSTSASSQPGFRSPLGSSSSSSTAHNQQQQQQQGRRPQQQQEQQSQLVAEQPQQAVFKFGVDISEAQAAAIAAAAAAAAALAAKHSSAGTANALDHTFRLRLADSIPGQLAAAMQGQLEQHRQYQVQQQGCSQDGQQQQLWQQNDTRVPPLLPGASPPVTPGAIGTAATLTPAPQCGFGAQPEQEQDASSSEDQHQQQDQQQQDQQQQGSGTSADGLGSLSNSFFVPQPIPSAAPVLPSDSTDFKQLAASMFGRNMNLQDGSIQWKRGELLGEGAYGKVFCAQDQKTGQFMAVKALQLLGRSDSEAVNAQLRELQQELELYKKLKHQHIVGFLGDHYDRASNTLYIYLEWVPGGSIASSLQRYGSFNEEITRRYTRQLLLGLEYLHTQQVVHRDVKGGNALLTVDGQVKLADFGASKPKEDAARTDAMKSLKGSAFWMAPEILKNAGYGRKADIWSLGCTVLEMLTGKHPWPDYQDQFPVMLAISQTTTGPPRPPNISAQANSFLDQCFKIDPKERSTATELLQHPWLTGPSSSSGGGGGMNSGSSSSTRRRASLSEEV